MRRFGWMAMGLLGAAWLAGCGGSGGGGADTATISGRLASPPAARAAASGGPFYVEAVDEDGTSQDVATQVTDAFRLEVPANHDYVLVVGDAGGPIGGMRYGEPGHERFEFRVRTRADLGEIEVDPDSGMVRATDDSGIEEPDHADHPDEDHDGIPDHADADDDGDPMGTCADTDAAHGRDVFEANCARCHSAAEVGDEDAGEIAEVLAEGEDDMPAMPALVADAADIAAYLAGCSAGDAGPGPVDTDGDGVNDAVDQCPGTPAGANVDANGCEVASTPAPDGAALFVSTCGGCHNGNGLGSGTVRDLTGKSAAVLQAKLASGHQGFSAATFTAAQLDAISAALTP